MASWKFFSCPSKWSKALAQLASKKVFWTVTANFCLLLKGRSNFDSSLYTAGIFEVLATFDRRERKRIWISHHQLLFKVKQHYHFFFFFKCRDDQMSLFKEGYTKLKLLSFMEFLFLLMLWVENPWLWFEMWLVCKNHLIIKIEVRNRRCRWTAMVYFNTLEGGSQNYVLNSLLLLLLVPVWAYKVGWVQL